MKLLASLGTLASFTLPTWGKWIAILGLTVAAFLFGMLQGVERTNDRQREVETKIIYKQGEVTERIVTEYIYLQQKQEVEDVKIKEAGEAYEITFPDNDFHFNNEFVRLFDASVTGTLSPLSSGEPEENSSVKVSEVLEISIHNNSVARAWELRAHECEAWAKEQEEANQ